jgi:hypothetical protein
MAKHRHIPRTPGFKVIDGEIHEQVLVRQVLVPGKRKAAPHPMRDRLRAAMDGKPTRKDES